MFCVKLCFQISINGRNVICEGGLHFDNHDESTCDVDDKTQTLHNNSFETNLELQEMNFVVHV